MVLIHGWPLSGRSWEKQVAALLEAGYRVIAYDRRGFGESSKPVFGYDYNTLAEDLDKFMNKLRLRHATLVGFSMGGGEVVRYLANYGSARVERAVFVSAVPPFLLKTADNPGGVDGSLFEEIKQSLRTDRLAFLSTFLADFYNVDVLRGTRVSDQVVQLSWNIGAAASPKAMLDCVSAWGTDFRNDLVHVDMPTLIVHGDADRILPWSATAGPLHQALAESRLVTVEGGPHGIIWTHADLVNRELLTFLEKDIATVKESSEARLQ